MPELVPNGEAAPLRAAARIDRDHRPARCPDDCRVATVEGSIFDEGTPAPGDRFEVDFLGVRYAEAHEDALGGSDGHSPPPSSSRRSNLARSSRNPSRSLSESPSPLRAAAIIFEANSGSRARILSSLAFMVARSNATIFPLPARHACSSDLARSMRSFAPAA